MTVKRTILAAAAALALTIGSALPATAATTKTWWYDCDTTGIAKCSGSDIGDAWESFDALKKAPWYSYRNPLTYMRTFHKYPMVGKQSIVVKSVNLPHTWHVFTYRNKR